MGPFLVIRWTVFCFDIAFTVDFTINIRYLRHILITNNGAQQTRDITTET